MDKRQWSAALAEEIGAERLLAVAVLLGMSYGALVGRSVREVVQNAYRAVKPSDDSVLRPRPFFPSGLSPRAFFTRPAGPLAQRFVGAAKGRTL